MWKSVSEPIRPAFAPRDVRSSSPGTAGEVVIHSLCVGPNPFLCSLTKLARVTTRGRCRRWMRWNSERGEKRSVSTRLAWPTLCIGRRRACWRAKARREPSRAGWRRASTCWRWPATRWPAPWRIPSLQTCGRTRMMRCSGRNGPSSPAFRRRSTASRRPMRSVAGSGPGLTPESCRPNLGTQRGNHQLHDETVVAAGSSRRTACLLDAPAQGRW